MPTFVALLRGVNVGSAKRVPMADLRALLFELGYSKVATVINSGNAVFTASAGSPKKHARAIADGIASRLKIDVPVIVKTSGELSLVVAEDPLAAAATDPSRLLVALAADSASLARLSVIATLATPPEKFVLCSQAAYLHCPGGFLESKAGKALLGAKSGAVTTRNWATTLKLHALAGESAA